LPEWWIERGIGESRHVLVEGGEIVEARIELEGVTRAGSMLTARLINAGPRNAIASDEAGTEYLLPKGSGKVSEGSAITIEVTREAIPGSEPWKRPLARVADAQAAAGQSIRGREMVLQADELGEAGWNDLIDQARSGAVEFAGGELRISPTPAMTLIDVDGHLPPDELAVRGAAEAAKAIRRLDIGGSIGIDLPTAGSKASRQAAAAAIDDHLPQPFERTAVNGFGFVQIVRPRSHASLIELAQDRASFEARALLRRVAFEPPGPKQLAVHPAVAAVLDHYPDWLDALSRQVGGSVGLRPDANLPISGGYAEGR
jgi:ribonuclease G